MKRVLVISLLSLTALAALVLAWRRAGRSAPSSVVYRTAPVERGEVTLAVTASGALSAITTVAVGSQVSGNIAKLHADYNDTITAGQLIAEIDPTSYQARLVQAEADYLSAQATLELKQLNARRTANLLAQSLVSQSDYDEVAATLRQQEAATKKAEAAVNSARLDVAHCQITSPIDGVVLSRAVDIGQTVQASFSAPTLFTLAQDLRRMQITANISEADIGDVRGGQPVSFTVDAFPGRKFEGTVREVRNNSTTTNNVVTYPTIISVDNSDLQLRPGMTANVTIVTARRTDVLRVPNAALRFRPAARALGRNGPPAPPSSPPPGAAPAPAAAPGAISTTSGSPGQPRLVNVVSADAVEPGRTELRPTPVQTGLANSTHTEILAGLEEGALVAIGTQSTTAAETAASTVQGTNNPFGPPKPPSGKSGTPPPPPM